MKTFKVYIFSFISFLFSGSLNAQLTVTEGSAMGYTPLQLVQAQLVGQGITVSNASFNGTSTTITSDQIGYFTTSGTATQQLGITAGVLMTSGKASNAIGPNNSAGAGSSTTYGADPDLDIIANFTTYDKCVLEFDFVPQADTLRFKYVFGSEEFYEWCASNYNDAFGFFLSGPGITGIFSNNSVNIALMPGSMNYVTINNLCSTPFSNWNNAGGLYYQYDGISFVFNAWHIVVPCSTYHIKLAIADVFDRNFDSGVFLEKNSFSSTGLLVSNSFQSTNFGNSAVEGCSDATVSFLLQEPAAIPYTVHWTVGGTATNGIDYTTIPDSITIPAGADSAAIVIHPFLDGLTEGVEYVILGVIVPSCSGPTTFNDTIRILDNTQLSVFAGNDITSCPRDSVTLTAIPSGGKAPYAYSWSTGSMLPQIKVAPPIGVNTYIATITDGCMTTDDDTVIVTVDSLPRVTNTTLLSSICSGATTNIVPTSNKPGAIFFWTANSSSPNISGYSNGSGLSINQTLINSGFTIDTVNYNVHAVYAGCAGLETKFHVAVYPKPNTHFQPVSQSICSGQITNVILTSDVTGTNFSWTAFSGSSNVSGFSAGSGTTISQILINSGYTTETVTYKIVPHANGCNGDTSVFNIAVYPVPDAYSQPVNESLCSGGTTNLVLLSHVTGATYTWSAMASSPAVTGFSGGANDTIIQTLSNSGNTAETVTYTVSPVANACPAGISVNIIVTVFPVTHLTTSPLTQTICNNSSTGINLTASVNGSSFTWTCTSNSPNVSGCLPGSGFNINQTLLNVGYTTETATYHITPTANGCTGSVTDFTVTINPSPDLSNSPAASQVCNNTPTGVTLTSHVAGTQFTWTCTPSSGNVTGWSNNAVPVNILDQILVNSGLNIETVTYHITPQTNGCFGSVTDYIVTVVQSADVYFIPSTQTICSLQNTNIQLLSHVPGSTFSWTASGSSPLVTGFLHGSGPVIQQTLTNSGTNIETVTYTVSPAAYGCPPGASQNVLVTVNPKPAITNNVTTFQQCSAATTNIVPTSSISGSTYTWTATGSSSQVTGYASGSGLSIQQTIINTGFNIETVTYSVIPIANGCIGNPTSFEVISYPVADVFFTPASQTICPKQTCNIANNSHVTGATFAWTASGSSFQASGFSPGSGLSIQQILYNSGHNIEFVTYHVSPTANGCLGTNADVIITIDPAPSVSLTTCNDMATTTNAKPFRLKGGVPLGGTYSGRGVVNGYFNPSASGVGNDTIIFSYTNGFGCNHSDSLIITVLNPFAFTCGDNLTDIRDNGSYPTVQIGTQCWMAANLNYGTMSAYSMNQRDDCQPEKYCFNNNPANCSTSGGLYQWDEVMQYETTPFEKGLCPPGWHIPGETELNTLFNLFVSNGFAGSPLKYSGYSGFNALLDGVYFKNAMWNFKAFATFFWSSTSHGPLKAWAHGMNEYNPSVSFYPSSRSNAFNVRCLKD